MILSYKISGDKLTETAFIEETSNRSNISWIDLCDPTADEKKTVEDWFGIGIPTHEDMVEIEESSRFYVENNVQFLTTPLLYITDNKNHSVAPVTFMLTEDHLVTLRYTAPKAITLFKARVAKSGNGIITAQSNTFTILLGLLEAITEQLADHLEAVSMRIGQASRLIFHHPSQEHPQNSSEEKPMTTADFRTLLTQIGRQGTLLSMVRESIAGINRFLVYTEAFRKTLSTSKDLRTVIKSIERDIQALENYADFLSNKMAFLLDTVVGMISTEQNAIIKIFSVVAVGFMPPTLIASIYGMNFQFMPELSERWGYPIAILLMIISAIIPLLYFKKKGWL